MTTRRPEDPLPDPPAGSATGTGPAGEDDAVRGGGPVREGGRAGWSPTDALVAVCGVLGALLLVAADRGQRLGLGLLALGLLAVQTGVASHTAVVGRHPTRTRRVLGAVLAVTATVLFVALSAHSIALVVPGLAVVAGLGRTGSWRLRLVGLAAVVVGAVLV